MSAFQGNVTSAQRDAQGFADFLFQNSMSMVGDTGEGTNLIFVGFAKPGSSTGAPVWQIRFITYDLSGNVTRIQWPSDGTTRPTNQFRYVWDDRTDLTYS